MIANHPTKKGGRVTVAAQTGSLILYDGVCGLCNGFVQFVLRHDHDAKFRFAALQTNFARTLMEKHGAPDDLKTAYVFMREGTKDRLLSKSEAALYVLQQLGGVWQALALTLKVFPRTLRDWGYDWIARRRYSLFGRHETCPVPAPDVRGRFLELP